MPAIMSHHQFGIAVLAKKGAGSFGTRAERDAFLLGAQGPDPFFFATRTPSLARLKRFGTGLHSNYVDESIDMMLELIDSTQGTKRLVLDAYMSGYLCHFSLDSVAHPFVYYWEGALCGAGVRRLDERDTQFVHSQVEADIDAFLLWQMLGKTVADIRITRYALQGGKKVLNLLDLLYAPIGRELYGLELPSDLYSRSIHDTRMVFDFIQSPSGRKRTLIGQVERALPGRRHSLLQALSMRSDVYDQCAFANLEHAAWLDPTIDSYRTESLMDLFETAAQEAVLRIEMFQNGQVDARMLTSGLDFNGNYQKSLAL
ncbi:MAG: zinc dependent phospholipase C family protein [Coriobacteriia bacterium]|nr:zinc dependent phospholipase C family protein [Coriobacteriia bacterium]